jgi:5S rRNA maturation endonuclease (ribonuclease M5)
VLQSEKESDRKKRLTKLLEELRSGVVVVEGKHDIEVFRKLGIEALTYGTLMGDVDNVLEKLPEGCTIFIIMDDDKSGEFRTEQLKGKLLEKDLKFDEHLGERLLKALNLTSVEQILKPIEEILNS